MASQVGTSSQANYIFDPQFFRDLKAKKDACHRKWESVNDMKKKIVVELDKWFEEKMKLGDENGEWRQKMVQTAENGGVSFREAFDFADREWSKKRGIFFIKGSVVTDTPLNFGGVISMWKTLKFGGKNKEEKFGESETSKLEMEWSKKTCIFIKYGAFCIDWHHDDSAFSQMLKKKNETYHKQKQEEYEMRRHMLLFEMSKKAADELDKWFDEMMKREWRQKMVETAEKGKTMFLHKIDIADCEWSKERGVFLMYGIRVTEVPFNFGKVISTWKEMKFGGDKKRILEWSEEKCIFIDFNAIRIDWSHVEVPLEQEHFDEPTEPLPPSKDVSEQESSDGSSTPEPHSSSEEDEDEPTEQVSLPKDVKPAPLRKDEESGLLILPEEHWPLQKEATILASFEIEKGFSVPVNVSWCGIHGVFHVDVHLCEGTDVNQPQ